MKIFDLWESINKLAPFETALDYDNTGLLCGDKKRSIKTVMISLDITLAVIKEAKSFGAECIISHHPVIFEPLKRINEDHPAYYLIKEDIAAICAHTNLDFAEDGVNDALAEVLQLQDFRWFSDDNTQRVGRMGILETEKDFNNFLIYVKNRLNSNVLRYNRFEGNIKKVACIGGAGGSYYKAAKLSGCDVLVTGEAKYNNFLEASEINFPIIEAGHFSTENVVLEKIEQHLRRDFPDLNIIHSSHIDIIEGV